MEERAENSLRPWRSREHFPGGRSQQFAGCKWDGSIIIIFITTIIIVAIPAGSVLWPNIFIPNASSPGNLHCKVATFVATAARTAIVT